MKVAGKKALAALLTLPLMLTACGGGGGNGDNEGKNGSTAFNETGFPIANDQVTLKFVTTRAPQQTKPHQELKVVKDFEGKTNVHIEWDASSQGYEEKKNLMFASGDLPDVFYGSESLNDMDIVTYGSQGQLIPLNDLIDQYAPNVKKMLEARPDIKRAITAPDGNIYSLPSIQEEEHLALNDVLFINKKWLDELGMKLPTTMDEFEQALAAFKTKDPNKNGKADEIPFSFIYGHDLLGIYSMYGAFGRLDTSSHIVVENGKVVFTADKPEFKEATAYFHKLYSQGLIDPESFTQERSVLFSKGKNKDAPILGAYVGWAPINVVGPEREKDYVPLPPLKGPDGQQTWNRFRPGFMTRAGFAITANNKYPEASIRWIDAVYDEKASLEWNWGPIGLTMEEKGDGTYRFKPTPEGMSFDEFRHGEAPGNTSARLILKDTINKIEKSDIQQYRADLYEQFKPFLAKDMYPNVLFPAEDMQRLAVLQTDINSHITKTQAQWIIDGNYDGQWDSYVQALKKMGSDELIEIYQKNMDAYNAQ